MSISNLRNLFFCVLVSTVFILISMIILDSYETETPQINSQPQQFLPKFVNFKNTTFLRNPPICSNLQKDSLLLIIVHSARSHVGHRSIIRQTLESFKTLQNWDIRLVFILGVRSYPKSKSKFEIEIESNQDIVIGDFIDTYRNLSYKHMMGYKWTLDHCPKAQYIFKMDDDVTLDLPQVLGLIPRMNSFNFFSEKFQMACHVHKSYRSTKVLRERRWKNPTSFKEYHQPYFPLFCSGFAYIVTRDVVSKIYEIHDKIPYLWLDDVWITGILRSNLANGGAEVMNFVDQIYFPNNDMEWIRIWFENFEDLNIVGENIAYLFYSEDKLTRVRTLKIWFKIIAQYLFTNDVNLKLIIE